MAYAKRNKPTDGFSGSFGQSVKVATVVISGSFGSTVPSEDAGSQAGRQRG